MELTERNNTEKTIHYYFQRFCDSSTETDIKKAFFRAYLLTILKALFYTNKVRAWPKKKEGKSSYKELSMQSLFILPTFQ